MTAYNNYNMVYLNEVGELIATDFPAVVRNGHNYYCSTEFIPLPEGSDLMYLPGRSPIAYVEGEVGVIESPDNKPEIFPLAATLPAGYTRLALPAYENKENAPVLPLFGYTAVADKKGKLYVAAQKTDKPAKWNPLNYPRQKLPPKIAHLKKMFPQNRLVDHLAHCALNYHCLTAGNIFFHRLEGGIPTSPVCNANCLGCISLQESECCPSPQERIKFRPTSQEIAELMLYHLQAEAEPIISFGQGCEGEPLLAYKDIAKAIKSVRQKTQRGIINMNTNAYSKDRLLKLRDAGLDSIRISMISNVEKTYEKYHHPNGYNLGSVHDTGRALKKEGLFISINLLTIPGLNDMPTEIKAWTELLQEGWVDLVQIRNLNLDPDWLFKELPLKEPGLGISYFLAEIAKYAPLGSFSPYNIKK